MILTRLDDLTQRMKEYQELKKHVHKKDQFHTRAVQIDNDRQGLATYVAIYKIFLRWQIPVQIDHAHFKHLLRQTQKVQQQYQESRDSLIVADSQLTAQFWNPLHELATKLPSELLSAWQTYIAAILSTIPTEFFQVFEQSGHYHTSIVRLREQVNAVRQMSLRLPQDEATLARLAHLARDMQHNMSQLPLGEWPDAIRILFENVIAGTATFEHVTEETLRWVHTNHMADSMHIIFDTTQGGRRNDIVR